MADVQLDAWARVIQEPIEVADLSSEEPSRLLDFLRGKAGRACKLEEMCRGPASFGGPFWRFLGQILICF